MKSVSRRQRPRSEKSLAAITRSMWALTPGGPSRSTSRSSSRQPERSARLRSAARKCWNASSAYAPPPRVGINVASATAGREHLSGPRGFGEVAIGLEGPPHLGGRLCPSTQLVVNDPQVIENRGMVGSEGGRVLQGRLGLSQHSLAKVDPAERVQDF